MHVSSLKERGEWDGTISPIVVYVERYQMLECHLYIQ